MKFLLLIGGFAGFAIGLLLSWTQESPWPSCLWHGCVAALIASKLMGWWGNAWRKNLQHALNERQSIAGQSALSTGLKGGKA